MWTRRNIKKRLKTVLEERKEKGNGSNEGRKIARTESSDRKVINT